jgi:hypothetical protein
MITDVNVQIDYNNLDGTPGHIQMTLTGEQIEQTMRRRMQTLMPRTTNYKFTEIRQENLQLDTKKK